MARIKSWTNNRMLVGLAWFVTSALLSTYANTAFLLEFKSPLGHTFVRFYGAFVMSFAVLGWKRGSQLLRDSFMFYLPMGFMLFLANFSNSMALELTGITMTYVVKAAIPVFTVLMCKVIFGQKYSIKVYLSLIPIVCGVALASASDSAFNIVGLFAALASCTAQTLLNIGSKRTAQSTGVKGFDAFFVMAASATLLCAPIFLLYPDNETALFTNKPIFTQMLAKLAVYLTGGSHQNAQVDIEGVAVEAKDDHLVVTSIFQAIKPFVLMLLAALAYQLEYALNFMFVTLVDPVTFAVADIVRRLAVIITGALVFSKPLSGLNVAGTAVAMCGVLAYSFVSQEKPQPIQLRRQASLLMNPLKQEHEL